jgi:hypothetical protein
MSCEVSDAPPQTLSSASAGVVHEFSDMDVMPISQVFLEFIAERAQRARSRAKMRASSSSRRVGATYRDAEGVDGYTFR